MAAMGLLSICEWGTCILTMSQLFAAHQPAGQAGPGSLRKALELSGQCIIHVSVAATITLDAQCTSDKC